MNKKSLIIIGGGITGLSTGITWAKNNPDKKNPPLIIEKQPIVGGYVTSFKRQGYLFDTTQIIPDVFDILNYFGVKIGLKKFEGYYARIFLVDPKTGGKKIFKIPSSLNGFEYQLMNRYPGDIKQIKHFFSYSREMYQELYKLKTEPRFTDYLRMLFSCQKIIRNAGKTFEEYYNTFNIKNPEIKEIFNVFAAFSGMPASRTAALLTVSALNSTLDGAYRPTKGFIEFPVNLRKKFEELGGEVQTNTEVTRIIVENGVAKGVETSNGKIFESDYVVTTIDPTIAMTRLIEESTLEQLDKKYLEKVKTMKMSSSSFHISLGLDDSLVFTDQGYDCGYNVLTTGNDTFEQLYKGFDDNKQVLRDNLFHAGIICPSLSTGGKNTLIIRVVPAAIAKWTELRENNPDEYNRRKEEIADFYIDKVEKYMIPNLRKHIVVKDIATPATFARYSGSPTGSNYDMAPYPENFGRKRLKMRTPVKNLFQPKFSHGIWPSLQAGIQVVDMILEGKVNQGYSRMHTAR